MGNEEEDEGRKKLEHIMIAPEQIAENSSGILKGARHKVLKWIADPLRASELAGDESGK